MQPAICPLPRTFAVYQVSYRSMYRLISAWYVISEVLSAVGMKFRRNIASILSVIILKLVVCILLRVLGQVQGLRLTQHWFEYFIQ
jgi:vacuolar-type H+-ATPase subunit I/STV1